MRRDEIRPNPMMMLDHTLRAQMRPRTDRMAIEYDDHFKSQGRRRADGRVDAEVCCPSSHQDTPSAELTELGLQRRTVKSIVQRLTHYAILWMPLYRLQE